MESAFQENSVTTGGVIILSRCVWPYTHNADKNNNYKTTPKVITYHPSHILIIIEEFSRAITGSKVQLT